MRQKRYWDLEPHYISGPLAAFADVPLVGADHTITSASGAMVRHNGDFSPLWREQPTRHDLGEVGPVYDPSFTTTSYESYVIENAGYCSEKWPHIETLIVVHSNPSQGDFRDRIRMTWGSNDTYEALRVRPLFFLGRSSDPQGEPANGMNRDKLATFPRVLALRNHRTMHSPPSIFREVQDARI